MTVAEAARQYIAAGLPPLPVPYRQKKPVIEGWPKLRLTADDVPKYFNGNDHPQNIGLLLGDDSGTTDADLDCMEAVRAAPFLLPETRMKFGHASRPVSHWFYRMDPPRTSLAYKDIRDHFRRNKQEGEITRALYLLPQKGLARFERQETGGRPIERWFATSRGGVTTKGG